MTCLMKPRPWRGATRLGSRSAVPWRRTASACWIGCAPTLATALPVNALSVLPIGCWIATRGSEIVGYACYDATAPDFFGPTRVLDSEQGHGVGTALLLRCLTAMREYGYGYAIIGSVGPVEFYQKTCNATVIPDSDPGIYKDFLRGMEKRAEKH